MGVKFNRKKKEYGDFQTPNELTNKILAYLKQLGVNATTIIEPTCGLGAFLKAAAHYYQKADIIGIDINSEYISRLKNEFQQHKRYKNIRLFQEDFFEVKWEKILTQLDRPVLFLGNLPWITSSELSTLLGVNLPEKYNIHRYKGINAITGKSNFDISEFMIITLLNAVNKSEATLAFLCKSSVVRKVLQFAAAKDLEIEKIQFHLIDSKKYFDISVSAGLLICVLKPGLHDYSCRIYNGFSFKGFIQELGIIEGNLIANMFNYQKWNHLQGDDTTNWRSGIKHDCSKVMELIQINGKYENGYGDIIELESDYLFPLLKSSDIANERTTNIERWLIVPQQTVGEQTSSIQAIAPQTWKYLLKHAEKLDNRSSRVYNNQPRFSIFGVGDYTFSQWKIAISGFYKTMKFQLIGPYQNKPVVFDDTCYFTPVNSKIEGKVLITYLNHPIVTEFYNSFIFWDSKRPITKEILKKLDIPKLVSIIDPNEILELIQKQFPQLAVDKLKLIIQKLSD